MPDVQYFSRVKLLDGSYASVKDSLAREMIAGATRFIGVTTTQLTDEQTISSVTIGGESVTLTNGDLMLYGHKEFIYAGSDGKVHELGDVTGLGSLAYKNSASGTYTPSGSISKPNVDVTPTTGTVKEIDNAGSVTQGTANTPTSVTLPTLATSLNGETLELTWTGGSVTPGVANTPTSVTLPTTKNTSVVTGVAAELHEAPSFTGAQDTITVS